MISNPDEDYGKKRLPGAYITYKKAGQADEIVFGRNDADYEGAETPDQGEHEISYASKKSCCKIGWLLNLLKTIGHLRAR